MSEMSKFTGPGHWRSLQELADTDEFRLQVEKEFPAGIEVEETGLSRRRFLQIMSASMAMATLAGCRWPEEKIVPFVNRAAGVTPGKPLQFATTMEMGSAPMSLLATSYDGRPIKIDGNPDSPLSGGAANVFAQASVLDVYDPDRSQKVLRRSGAEPTDSSWADFSVYVNKGIGSQGAGQIAVLTEATTSPSVAGLLRSAHAAGTPVYAWEPVCRRNEILGADLAFGSPSKAQLDLTAAQVIVDFDANLLQDHPSALRNNKEFVAGRDPESGHMNRLYSFENTFSTTGGMADHRFPTAASDIGPMVWALATQVFLIEGLPLPAKAGIKYADLTKWRARAEGTPHLNAVAKDLIANRGHGLLVAGLRQDPEVHAVLYILNLALGNVGQTISFLPAEMPPVGTIQDLAKDLQANRVHTLIILGGNPVYNAPADLEFGQAMQKAPVRIHLSDRDDETSALCTWHLPRAHYLESWGDATAWDGTRLAVQPLIEPLYQGKTAAEVLSLIFDETPRTGYQIARDELHGFTGGSGSAPVENEAFEKQWRGFIHAGLLPDSRPEPVAHVTLAGRKISEPAEAALSAQNLEIAFTQDQSLYDGRFANNAWLQEMPDFMSKLAWDNAALLSPATADELGVKHADLIELDYQGRKQSMPVYVLPGQAKYSVTVNLGYGRDRAGQVGQGAGFNGYTLRTSEGLHRGTGLKINQTGETYLLATTQDHHAIDEAGAKEIQRRVPGLVREGNLKNYEEDPHFVDHLGVHSPPLKSLWKEWEYTGHKWGMGVDLNACNGCNACVIGCQAENNIAVVGKEEVSRGREMSWIRLDRYFLGEPEDPKVVQQAVACAQCEMAPCEEVCPVAATMHTSEGLNAMVYNRCVGTRYCSNNCPYKVRRFNWFNNFEDLTETQKMVHNPDVTVRSRGVMEKCTYCVQRIESARVQARVEGRSIQDGDITPACQQTCPTDAIVFGDLNDPESRVSKLRERNRSYDLLNYLHLKPRTFYLARIRNPNPEIEPHVPSAGGHGAGHGADQDTGHEMEHDSGHESGDDSHGSTDHG
jgi:MoCo/4Fe-4S cofactor protein with predicted Tat translocation signal